MGLTDASSEHLRRATRGELYDLAREHDVPGRSAMTKDELRAALQQTGGRLGTGRVASRLERFRRLADESARGEFRMLPRSLTGNDRRLHVRQTLREDHQHRITRRTEDAEEKFDEIARSLYSFFRGTALLFYRDMAGEDAWMPTVLTMGDVHPENFGVMPNADNVPIFGVNDFDEAYHAPFTWDLKRGSVGFMIAGEEVAGHGRKRRRKIARRFVEGYLDGIRRFDENESELQAEIRVDNAPKLIRKLIEDAREDRAAWLADDYLDEFGRGFRSDDELVPISSRRGEFQAVVDGIARRLGDDLPPRAGGMRVKDVAMRRGQGTASLGLARYYVLIEGPRADGSDDLIIEIKQARRSALAGLVPPSEFQLDGEAERIAHAQAAQLVRGDVFYGSVELEGKSFMTRERAPYRDAIDLEDLSKSEWKDYAGICGGALAHAHALSDDVGAPDRDIEPEILEAAGPVELFADDIVRFAEEAADRVRSDQEAFRADHELGAFRAVDIVYR